MAAQPRRIVIGYDGSPAARSALDAAADLTGYGSTLTVVNVATEEGDAALAEARNRLLQQHVEARYVQAVGDPADELVAAARRFEADLVVVGRPNGHAAAAEVGALNAAVVSRASCDVLVVSDRSWDVPCRHAF
jgi:nucleotide-binding universal stress UspA family protein